MQDVRLTPAEQAVLQSAIAMVLANCPPLHRDEATAYSSPAVQQHETKPVSNDLELIQRLGEEMELQSLEDLLVGAGGHAPSFSMDALEGSPAVGAATAQRQDAAQQAPRRGMGIGSRGQPVGPLQWGLRTPQQSPRQECRDESAQQQRAQFSHDVRGAQAHAAAHVSAAAPAAGLAERQARAGLPGAAPLLRHGHQQAVGSSEPPAHPVTPRGRQDASDGTGSLQAPASASGQRQQQPGEGRAEEAGGALATSSGSAALGSAAAPVELASASTGGSGAEAATAAAAMGGTDSSAAAAAVTETAATASTTNSAAAAAAASASPIDAEDGDLPAPPTTAAAARAQRPVPEDPDPRVRALVSMYRRAVESRAALGERLARERRAEETQRAAECTFSPSIDERSRRLVTRSASPGYRRGAGEGQDGGVAWRAWSPRASVESPTTRERLQRAASPAPGGATLAGPGVGWSSPPRQRRPPAADERHWSPDNTVWPRSRPTSPSAAAAFLDVGATAPASAPPARPAREPEFGRRLYGAALHRQELLEGKLRQTLAEERAARAFTARPLRMLGPVLPRLYEPRSPPAGLPTGMEECTFHPHTNFRRMAVAMVRAGDADAAEGTALWGGEPATSTRQQQQQQDRMESTMPYVQGATLDALLRHGSPGGKGGTVVSPGPRGRAAAAAATAPSAGALGAGQQQAQAATFAAWGLGAAQSGVASGRVASSGSGSVSVARPPRELSPHLDWREFLDRQESFLRARELRRQERLAVGGASAVPPLSPGTARIFSRRALSPDGSGALDGMPFGSGRWSSARRSRGRSPGPRSGGGEGSAGGAAAAAVDPELTFRPKISERAARLRGRSLEEMVDGGRRRREERLEASRLAAEVERVLKHPFRPLYPETAHAYPGVKARVSLRCPERQLAMWAHHQATLAERQREAAREAAEREMAECTFRPQTTPLPAYLASGLMFGTGLREENLRLAVSGRQEEVAAVAALPEAVAVRQGMYGAAGTGVNAASPGSSVRRKSGRTSGGGSMQAQQQRTEHHHHHHQQQQQLQSDGALREWQPALHRWHNGGDDSAHVSEEFARDGVGHPGMNGLGPRHSAEEAAGVWEEGGASGRERVSAGAVHGVAAARAVRGGTVSARAQDRFHDAPEIDAVQQGEAVQQAVQLLQDLDRFLGQGGPQATGWAVAAATAQRQRAGLGSPGRGRERSVTH